MPPGIDELVDPSMDPVPEPPGQTRLDRVVFGIAAVIALSVVAWGIVDQASLAGRATSAQS